MMIEKLKIVCFFHMCILLVGCGEDDNERAIPASTLTSNTTVVDKKEPTALEVCMSKSFPDVLSFELLAAIDQDKVRGCVQETLRNSGRLKAPKKISMNETDSAAVAVEKTMTNEEIWIRQNSKSICTAGVSFKNRWGDPGQALAGEYLAYRNGEHIFREHQGTATVRCLIAGTRLLMGWHTRPFDIYKFGDLHYTFQQHGSGVRIIEHAYGETSHRDFEF